jgi:hypothetical protein
MRKLSIVILVAFGMLSCERPGDELPGRWDDRKGQIFEFNADYEPSPSARPEKFDPEQTKTYYKIK